MRVGFNSTPEPQKNSGDLGPVFMAQFDSTCAECGFTIYEGDDARYFEGEVMHSGCAEDAAGV